MNNKKLLFLLVVLFFTSKIIAQCNATETIIICDMTKIDIDNDGNPDGIINLYDEYKKQTGKTLQEGIWFDPGYNFALNEGSGELYLWDLKNSTSLKASPANEIEYYVFELYNSTCGDTPAVSIQIHLGAFSSFAVPTIGKSDINVQIIDYSRSDCIIIPPYDLNQTLLSNPSAHKNGIWTYLGDSPNFKGISENKYIAAEIPYKKLQSLVDQEVFEFMYSVPGVAPCATVAQTRVKIAIIRDVESGQSSHFDICEEELITGNYNADINLRDDLYLAGEDVEGTWQFRADLTKQITNSGDSTINLKKVYDDLYKSKQRFGAKRYFYTYKVSNRSTVGNTNSSSISFTFYEKLRPFKQKDGIPEFCFADPNTTKINLYDYLSFTTENGVLYDYPQTKCNNWSFVSGPSDLDLETNSGLCNILNPKYSVNGTIDLSNLEKAKPGTYVFKFTVAPDYNLQPEMLPTQNKPDPDGCEIVLTPNNPCKSESALVTIIINPINYAGEDTGKTDEGAIKYCEKEFSNADNTLLSVNLTSLLKTNDKKDIIYSGTDGTWTDLDSGKKISNPYTLPGISVSKNFNFKYETKTSKGCIDNSLLSFTVFEKYDAGNNNSIEVCNNDKPFDLFLKLKGTPNNNGTWTGPEGFKSETSALNFDPATFKAGDYVYEVPANDVCEASKATVTVNVFNKPNTGNDTTTTICQSDKTVDLKTLIDSNAEKGGVFIDLSNSKTLTETVLDLNNLKAGIHEFEYQIQGNKVCSISKSKITFNLIVVPDPKSENQTFCVNAAKTIGDLSSTNGANYTWFADETTTTSLSKDVLLTNNTSYFVEAKDGNNCLSKRTKITVTLKPLAGSDCEDGVNPGPDGELDLTNIAKVYPNFEVLIFNRYGTIIFKGNKDVSSFKGESNVALTQGNIVPSGIYFYVINPNDGETPSFNGNFYFSK